MGHPDMLLAGNAFDHEARRLHAWTSVRRDSRVPDQACLSSAIGASMKVWPFKTIFSELPSHLPIAATNILAAFNLRGDRGNFLRLGGKQNMRSALGKEAERVRIFLRHVELKVRACFVGEAALGEGRGQAAVGDVARGQHQPFGGELDEAAIQRSFLSEVELGRSTPESVEDGLGVVR